MEVMADIKVSTKLENLGISISELTQEVVGEMKAAVAEIASLTYNKAVELTSSRLHSTRQQYLDGLHFEQEGEGVYTIMLDADVDHLESGYPPIPMLPKLVQGPKAKIGKDGKRYVIIPIRQSTGDSQSANTVVAAKQNDLAARLKEVIADRKFKKVRQTSDPKTGKTTTIERMTGEAPHPYLKGLTRVREFKGDPQKEKPISSAYLTFRVASENQDPNTHWRHPGFAGAHVFPDLEKWADQQMDTILKDIFGK